MDALQGDRVVATRRRRRPIRRSIDLQRLAEGLKTDGIDTRVWVESGTVGVQLPSGEFVTSGQESAYARSAEEESLLVDVRLEPLDRIITARYHGLSCGRAGSGLFPIMPGDEVLVLFPGGSMKSGEIVAFLTGNNATAPVPKDWHNDRVLFDLSVPFHVRAPSIKLESSNLTLNGRRVNGSKEPI